MAFLITSDHLKAISGRSTSLNAVLPDWLNKFCPQVEIDTPQEYAHFLAQACHETDSFKTLREYASGKAYEGRKDLGNTQVGDGPRYKGRGIFQTTGRGNYAQLGIKLGKPLLFINNPQLLESPEHAVWSACEYWATRRLNDIANHPDTDLLQIKIRGQVKSLPPLDYISVRVNGGFNGIEHRRACYLKAKQVLV